MKNLLNKTLSVLVLFTLFISYSNAQSSETNSTIITTDTTPVAKDLKEINTILGPNSDIEAVAISPTGKILAAGGWDKNVYIYSLELENFGEVLHTFKYHSSAILSLSFDVRGQNLVCGSNDHSLTTWNVDSALNTGSKSQDFAINTVIHGPSAKYIYSCSKEGMIKLWDMKDPKRTRSVDLKQKINSFRLSKDRKFIYAAGASNTITKYNLKGVEVGALEGHSAFINEISLSPNGSLMASASDDKTVVVWELLKLKQKIVLEGHTAKVNAVAFTSDNKYIISGDRSGEVIIWEIETGDIIKRIPGLGRSIRNISISRYMDYIAVASYENTGDAHVVYYCSTGIVNIALDKKRQAAERKENAKRKQKEREENYDNEDIEDILNETQDQF